MTPTISTARLVLRPLKKPMGANLQWLRDPEVVRFSEQRHSSHTISTQLRYVNQFVGKSHLWAIHEVNTNEYIGNLSALHDAANDVSDVGIMIGATKYWRKGFGDEAWMRACTWLLEKTGGDVRKLEAGCMRSNLAMVKIIEGSGFKQEGERLNHFLLDGAPVSALLYGRSR